MFDLFLFFLSGTMVVTAVGDVHWQIFDGYHVFYEVHLPDIIFVLSEGILILQHDLVQLMFVIQW